MKKTHKKINNILRESLTRVCDIALVKIEGFKWLTHLVDYDDFPRSLKVICIFDTHQNQALAQDQDKHAYMCDLINQALLKDNIKLPNIRGQVSFDSEEKGSRGHPLGFRYSGLLCFSLSHFNA